MAAYGNEYTFCRMHMLTPFASKETFARIDYLRQGGRLVVGKGTQNVKNLAEKQTKAIAPCVLIGVKIKTISICTNLPIRQLVPKTNCFRL